MSTSGFDKQLAKVYVELIYKAVEQFERGISDPNYDGKIHPPEGWEQVAAFKAPELDLSAAVQKLLALRPDLAALIEAQPVDANGVAVLSAEHTEALRARVTDALSDAKTRSALSVGVREVFFGFALRSTSPTRPMNVIALRGTQTGFEWAADASALEVPLPLVWFSHDKLTFARAHLGFVLLFSLLWEQMSSAYSAFGNTLPTIVAGHSLGSALATLGALAGQVLHPSNPSQLYSYAGPRVGNDAFVGAYNFLVPEAYRVVNLSDLVPMVPPTSLTLTLFGKKFVLQYAHVGQEWSYLWQTGNVASNHELQPNYIPAVQKEVETNAPREYPNSGIPG